MTHPATGQANAGHHRGGGERHGMAGEPAKGLRGIHVLYILLGFFGTIFLVNGIFMYFALSTHSGAARANAYQSGLKYNERIAQARAQAALGWTVSLKLAPTADRLTFTVEDRSGFAVPGLLVTALVSRPATSAFDHHHVMGEFQPGQYSSIFGPLAPGGWIVNIKAVRPGDGGDVVLYRLRKRLWLEPKK